MIDPNTKASTAAFALRQVASDLRKEGNTALADKIETGVKELPVGKLAELFDLVTEHDTKAGALAALGAKMEGAR